jgi:hypothetical protein
MSPNRIKFLNNPDFTQLGTEVEKHIESWIITSNPVETAGLLDEVCLDILSRVYRRIGGSEGTVWLASADSKALVAVYNSGPNSKDIVGFEQPIGSGIISMVYAQQQPYCENEISPESGHDPTLDRQTHQATRAMVAVPFYFAFGLRGVISCVQLQESGGPEPSGFESSDVEKMVRAGNNVERLVNGRILSVALGFDGG